MQEAMLRLGPDIVIATPGRLIDHLHNAPNFSLESIEILVLDEADRYIKYHIYAAIWYVVAEVFSLELCTLAIWLQCGNTTPLFHFSSHYHM